MVALDLKITDGLTVVELFKWSNLTHKDNSRTGIGKECTRLSMLDICMVILRLCISQVYLTRKGNFHYLLFTHCFQQDILFSKGLIFKYAFRK